MRQEQNEQPIAGDKATRFYRTHVGTGIYYDVLSANQFNLLTCLGLREEHSLLDIGCGSLRAGRLFIPYLQPEKYCGIEPESWLVTQGLNNELGHSIVDIKKPRFSADADFTLTAFGQTFDFILAQSIFSHTSERQLRRCLSEAKKALKPEGLFAATYFPATRNYTGSHWTVKATWTPEKMQELAREQGLHFVPLSWPHPDPQQWILISHADHEVALPVIGDTMRMMQLEQDLVFCRAKLENLKSHPYVRLGLGVFRSAKYAHYLVWRAFRSPETGV